MRIVVIVDDQFRERLKAASLSMIGNDLISTQKSRLPSSQRSSRRQRLQKTAITVYSFQSSRPFYDRFKLALAYYHTACTSTGYSDR